MTAGVQKFGIGLCVTASLFVIVSRSHAIDSKAWATTRYNVQIHIAVDSAADPGVVSDDELIRKIDEQIHSLIYPLWNVEFVASQGAERIRVLERLDELEEFEEQYSSDFDKHLFLSIRASITGLEIACRERDHLTGRWTPVLRRTVRQELLLAEQCFKLICETFAPLAMVRIDPENDKVTHLDFMGAALSRSTEDELFVHRTTVFEPFLYRSKRSGGKATENLLAVPWTYLTRNERVSHGWKTEIFSGTRLPFGSRRRAGIDTIALAVKTTLPSTRVRFCASHDKSLGLAGYDVFQKLPGDKEFVSLGTTDQTGSVTVQRGAFPITVIALRSDAEVLAQVPILPGISREIDIPISDDAARLMVQESLTTFKEQLIDIVARRNILIARTRDQLKKGKKQEAQKLLDQLDELPNRSALSRQLDGVENNSEYRSENPRVQAKIERMLAESRKLLSSFLSTREIIELEVEVNNSETTSVEKTSAEPTERQL